MNVAKFSIKCQGPSGAYDQTAAPMKYVFKGKAKGNKVTGTYIDPLGGTGEHFTAKLTFAPATKSFAGTLAFVGRCKVKAKKV